MSNLVERLRKAALLLPIRRNDTADYAEIFGQDFQAMTVTPERFEALSVLPEATDCIEVLEAENARLREALQSLLTDWHDCMGHRGTKGERDALAALTETGGDNV